MTRACASEHVNKIKETFGFVPRFLGFIQPGFCKPIKLTNIQEV